MAASLYPQVAIRQNVIPITLSHFIRQRHCFAISSLCRDRSHTFPAIIHLCRLFCGADHLSHSRFHFEVENNSLQTFNPCR
ncbi:hypothetical protein E1K98_10430 [Salmonella enterica subsp. enterica serovar Fluntern]|nr:hypothetical protein [Salmonella enterica subsp. enterica serovar Fluntern]EAB1661110.1 hypothetical protein [Salmonella enterica]ECI0550261.1 hypothetical protein [Salmonella enterica subsp. enterica]EAA3232974.1 hypothetical protein [Salmonella enterica subsp. enterica serovar Fluntern]EAA3236453.1 hypothetical protein [Salmonella enterica subsp. enterica serovar Fluntern]